MNISSIFCTNQLSAVMPTGTLITASSSQFDLDLATDGIVGTERWTSFITNVEQHPWLQFEFPEATNVIRIIVVQRVDDRGHLFQNVGLFVGSNPAANGQLSTNPMCATYPRKSNTSHIDVIECDSILEGKYLVIQKMEPGKRYLTFSEIVVHVGDSYQGWINIKYFVFHKIVKFSSRYSRSKR